MHTQPWGTLVFVLTAQTACVCTQQQVCGLKLSCPHWLAMPLLISTMLLSLSPTVCGPLLQSLWAGTMGPGDTPQPDLGMGRNPHLLPTP